MAYIFKNRMVMTGDLKEWEYLIISEGKVMERFACKPAKAKELMVLHNLTCISYADCARMGVF
jgi:hypothetical protein